MSTHENNPFDAQPAAPLDLVAALRPVRKYKWLILASTLLVFGTVTAWTVRQPKIFEAVGTIEYDPDPPRPLGQSVEVLESPGANLAASKEFFATQNMVLASRSLAEKVVTKLGLQRDADFLGIPADERATFSGVAVPTAAAKLQDRLTVEQETGTRLVKIRIRDRDPEKAALLVNTLIDCYVEKTMQDRLASTVSALEWLSQQLDSLKGQLERSEHALYDFKKDHNVLSVSLEDRQNLLATEMAKLSDELTRARTRRIELHARVEALRSTPIEDLLVVRSDQLKTDSAISELRRSYREKLAEREALTTEYGDNHPSVKSLNATIAQLEHMLRMSIEEAIGAVEMEFKAAQAIEQKLASALAAANQAGIELNLQEIEYSRLNRERENQAKLYQLVLERTAETDLTRMLKLSHVRPLDRALAPSTPLWPRVQLNVVLGLAGGLMLGVILAFLAHLLDRTLKGSADIEQFGIALLGFLPKFEHANLGKKMKRRGAVSNDLIVHNYPQSSVAEHCRTIRTNLMFMGAEEPLRTLLLTSANPKEGKTTVAVSLAISLAQSGKRVLLIDTDLRRPRVHKAFGVPNLHGVTSVLVGESSLKEAIVDSGVPGVSLLLCGPIPPNPAELLHTARFRELLAEAAEMFDQVVLDSPPLGAVTDAAVIAPQVSGVLLVARAKRTTRDALSSAIRQLRAVSANMAGTILNEIDSSDASYGYGGYYHHAGYYSADDESPPPAAGGQSGDGTRSAPVT